jgi:putative acetyltransferase
MLTIAVESPLSDDVRRLVGELNETSLALSPREFCHHMTVEQMAGADTTLFVARDGTQAVAIGALKRHGGGVGEVKRMYTVPAYRGRGLAGRILGDVEALARREGLDRLVLETGSNFYAAARVYERGGFKPCDPVLDYAPSPYTAFFEKPLKLGVSA